jgi:predicted LPLAT superfamily acyltransferase
MSSNMTVAEWTRRRERGSMWFVRFLTWLALAIGRPVSRGLPLRPVSLYFFVTAGAARRHAARFLERALGRPPTLAEEWRHFLAFCSTVHDRVYFLRGRFDLFDVRVEGAQDIGEGGALLMGGHIGSFEALRACGREMGKRRVAMAMYQVTANLHDVLAGVNPEAASDIVALGRPESMIELASLMEEGALVGMLADRTRGDEPVIRLPFLGVEAPLPTGPMRVAAALRARVLFMTALYRGGNRYDVRFEPLADFGAVDSMSRAQRDAAVREAIAEYVRRLERCAREAPDNWFNFHDFWGDTP